METDKIASIRELNKIRKELVKSSFYDLSLIIDLLEKARKIAQAAPLRSMIRYDGTPFTNLEERQFFLNIVDKDINELPLIKVEFFNPFRSQMTITIVQLMISISDFGIPELVKIINE
jgi:hypothetical protein